MSNDLAPYRTVDDKLGAMRRVHAVDRSALRRAAWGHALAGLAGAIAGFLVRRTGALEFGIGWFVTWCGITVLLHRFRVWGTSNIVVRERGIQIGEREWQRSIDYSLIRHVEQGSASVRLHLVSGEKVSVRWVEELPALADAVRERVTASRE